MSKTDLSRPTIRKDGNGHRKTYSYKYQGYGGYKRETRPRRLNVWLLVATIAFLAVSGPALYFWHAHQIDHLSSALLEHADKMAAEENWREASDAYYRVWEIRKDPELLGKMTPAFDKYAASRDPLGVIASYQRAVGALPARLDMRIRLSELLVQTGQFQLALNQANKVLASESQNTEAMKWRALSLLALQRSGQTVEADVLDELRSAFIAQQGDFDLAFGLIGHLRRDLNAENNSEYGRQADAVINRLVIASPNNAKAYLARYQYRTQYGQPGAKQDLAQAILLAPDNPTVIQKGAWDALRGAIQTKGNSGYLTTRQLFKKLIELQPENPSGYLGLGDAEYLVRGDIEQAIKIWQQGRERAGDNLPLLLRIVEGQTNLYKYTEAAETLTDVDQYLSTLTSKGSEGDRKWATASAALFRGKINLANNRPYAAIPQFQLAAELGNDANSEFRAGKSTALSALLSLGKTYSKLGQMKDAASCYDRAIAINPESESALLAGADAWAALGDLDRAIGNTERVLRLPDSSAEANRYLAQYLLERTVATPEVDRDWSDFLEAFQKARWQLADSWKLRLLDVDYAIRQSGKRDVSAILGKLLSLESDFPDDVQVWRRLPAVYEMIGLTAETDRALNRLEEITSSSPEAKFVLVDILLARGKTDDAQVVLDGVSGNQLVPQEVWLHDLAQLRVVEARGDAHEIDLELLTMIKKYPMNVSLVERLLDRRLCGASKSNSPTTADLIETLKKRQVNAEANWQYFEARHQLASASPDIELVRSHLASLRNRLPYWSRTQELAGRVALLDQNDREARNAFADAVTKPRPNPELLHLLIRKNLETSDYLSAFRLVEKQRQSAPLSRTLSANGSELQERLDFELVDQGVQHASELHETLWSRLVRKTTSKKNSLEGLDGAMLALCDLETTQAEREGLLKRVKTHRFDSEDKREFVMGQAYELLANHSEALESFGRVNESSRFRFDAELHAGNAKQRLRSKRNLVVTDSRTNRDSKKRLEAILLLRRAGKTDLAAAKTLLESMVGSSSADDNDRLLLASCLEKLGDTNAAKQQLVSVVENAPSAQHLSTLIDFLLRTDDHETAQGWIEQLEDQTGWSTPAVALRTRWMAATNRQAEITALVESFAQRRFQRGPEDIPGVMRDIAEIYRDVNMTADAKRWLEMLASRFPDHAEPLSFLLVENDETERAIQRCVSQLESSPSPDTAALLARILVYGEVSPETLDQVRPLLQESINKFPNDASLLFAVGNLHLKTGNTKTAIELLTKVTEIQPGHYLAWNNLAALLAEQEGRKDDAMSTIDKAISFAAYDIPTLYDTKAVVLIHKQEYETAAELLQESVTDSRSASDPRFFFHLAMSLDQLGDEAGAKTALEQAHDLDLDASFLTLFEEQELSRLRNKFTEQTNE